MKNDVVGYVVSGLASEAVAPTILSTKNGDVEFRAQLQRGGEVNRNKNTYSADLIWEASKDELVQTLLQTGSWRGEANHPMEKTLKRQLYTDHRNVSHTMRTFERQGDVFYSNIITSRTEVGKALAGYVEQGSKVGFSFRGLATYKKHATKNAAEAVAMRMYTYDWVDFPSHRDAYLEEIISTESTEFQLEISNADLLQIANENGDNYKMIMDLMEVNQNEVSLKLSGNNVITISSKDDTVHMPINAFAQKLVNELLS